MCGSLRIGHLSWDSLKSTLEISYRQKLHTLQLAYLRLSVHCANWRLVNNSVLLSSTTAHDKNNPIAGYTLVCCLHSRLLVIVCWNVCSDFHVFISSPRLFHTDARISVFIVLSDITLTLTWKSFLIKVLNENNKDKNQLFLKLYLLFSELCVTKCLC